MTLFYLIKALLLIVTLGSKHPAAGETLPGRQRRAEPTVCFHQVSTQLPLPTLKHGNKGFHSSHRGRVLKRGAQNGTRNHSRRRPLPTRPHTRRRKQVFKQEACLSAWRGVKLGEGLPGQPPLCLNIVLPASSEEGVITACAFWSAEKPRVTCDLLVQHLK